MSKYQVGTVAQSFCDSEASYTGRAYTIQTWCSC